MDQTELNKYLNCRIYPEERPEEHDLVLVTARELQPDLGVIVTLNEYNDCEGTIYLKELTRKKRIRSLSKICTVGQTFVAEVVQSESDFISLSKRHVADQDQEEYLKYHNLGMRLHSILKKIAIKRQTPLVELCEAVSWPLYRDIAEFEKLEEKVKNHPIHVLVQKEMIPNLSFSKVLQDYLIENHLELFGEQTYKGSFVMHLLSYGMNGVDDIKNNLQKCLDEKDNFPKISLEIVTSECPKYQFNFSGTDKEQVSAYQDRCKEILQCFKTLGYHN